MRVWTVWSMGNAVSPEAIYRVYDKGMTHRMACLRLDTLITHRPDGQTYAVSLLSTPPANEDFR